MTASDTSVIESSTRKKRSEYPIVTTSPPRSAPPKPATNPATANAVSFVRVAETVSAAAARSFSRTPMMARPIPVRRR